MAISRFQMNRQLRAYGGMMGDDGRKAYGIGSFFQKKIMAPIKKAVKSPVGVAAALTAANFAPKFIPAGRDKTLLLRFLPSVSQGLKTARGSVSNIFKPRGADVAGGIDADVNEALKKTTQGDGILKKVTDIATAPILGTDKTLAGLLMTPQALALGSGLLAGAFTKDEDDPAFTGQDVGLNLRDIRKLANITDPKTGQAIGLSFLPDVEARKFTPAEMAASFAAADPVDFTEDRTPAQDGCMMGDQKDFEEFLQDMQDRDKQMLQDRILQDFEKFMKRKRMIDQMPEAKDGGIMKMAEGGMMDMGGMEMDLRGGGFVPMGKAEKADDVPARLSKNEFVFTADAVRAAGGGNIDKGADKMYATMKALENKVA